MNISDRKTRSFPLFARSHLNTHIAIHLLLSEHSSITDDNDVMMVMIHWPPLIYVQLILPNSFVPAGIVDVPSLEAIAARTNNLEFISPRPPFSSLDMLLGRSGSRWDQ